MHLLICADLTKLEEKRDMIKGRFFHVTRLITNYSPIYSDDRRVGSFLQDPRSVSGFYTTNIGKISCRVLLLSQTMNSLKENRSHRFHCIPSSITMELVVTLVRYAVERCRNGTTGVLVQAQEIIAYRNAMNCNYNYHEPGM